MNAPPPYTSHFTVPPYTMEEKPPAYANPGYEAGVPGTTAVNSTSTAAPSSGQQQAATPSGQQQAATAPDKAPVDDVTSPGGQATNNEYMMFDSVTAGDAGSSAS